jgi:hypothetical protein
VCENDWLILCTYVRTPLLFGQISLKKIYFVANAFISPFNTQTMHIKSFLFTTALLCFPKNLIPWWDSNTGLLVPEADAMSTAPRRQGNFHVVRMYLCTPQLSG